VDPDPGLVREIEPGPAAWVLQDAGSASGYLTRFADRRDNRRRLGIPDMASFVLRGRRLCAARAEILGVLRSEAAAAGRITAGQEKR
jgi:hypothetical protein